MVLTVDTEVLAAYSISTDAGLMLDLIWKARKCDRDLIIDATNWSRGKVGALMTEVEVAGLFTEGTGEFTDTWATLYQPSSKVEAGSISELAKDIINHINKRTGKNVKNTLRFEKDVMRLRASRPTLTTFKHFAAVIDWAWDAWSVQLRPHIGKNLFSCTPKLYEERVEKALDYWRSQKLK